MCNRTNTDESLEFNKPTYHSRELISKFLPPINFEGKAKFYVPEFSPYFKYNPDDINVKIVRGEHVSGVLDKATIGQEAEGGIFHTIYSEKGASTAIECIYNLQQLINNYLYYNGVTFGLKDVYLSKTAKDKLRIETAKIITASEEVTQRLNEGKLVPPIEMSLQEYYEELQTAALEHGDEFLKPMLEEIDPDDNWLYKFIYSGSKGDRTNMTAIYSSIGSIGLKGSRIPMSLNGRTTINFPRFSTEPISRGYCPNNFSEGISPIIFPFAALEARYELIEVALSTALAGTMNRNAVKNLESIVVSNFRGSIKENRLVQLLFGETGIDPRKVEKVQFPSVKIGDRDFEQRFRTLKTQVDKVWRNREVEAELDSEFEDLRADRANYRHIMFALEQASRRNFLMKDTLRMPVNPQREISNVVQIKKETGTKPDKLDPVKTIRFVREYVTNIGYMYMNSIQRANKVPVPRHIENSVTFLKILIRSWLCTANLLRNGIDFEMLQAITERISLTLQECFIEPGTSVGIIAAESMSEPATQFLLDAKHRSGLKKDKTNMIDRFDEILKNKSTENLHNPIMTLIPLPEYQDDRQKVMEIANHIEMLPLRRFITSTKVFIEDFQKPEYPELVAESKMIEKFQAFNLGDPTPKDLISWCIRFELNKEEMILKSMKVKTIYLRLMERFPFLYIVYSAQNSRDLLLRIYIRNVAFKRGSDISKSSIVALSDEIKACIIRGIEGITAANVVPLAHTYITEDGALDVKKMYIIETDGTNLSLVLENPYLDIYECNTTSMHETEVMYGIEAARNKTVDELLSTLKYAANYEWATIYADEMSYNGRVTSIQRSGLGQRELNQIMLRASFGSPIQVLQQAAINNQTDKLHGMSAPLVMGTIPRFGTTFNDIMIDQEAVKRMTVSDAELIEAI